MKRHWYFITVEECVLCGLDRIHRERRYGRRPKSWAKRHEYIETACSGHFL